jgi:hypothetical protein
MKHVTLTPQQSQRLMEWDEASKSLAELQELEMKLRKSLVEDGLLFDASKLEGTETIEIGNGYQVKATKTQYYNAENKEGQTTNLVALLPAELAQSLVKWQPKISTSVYKNTLAHYLHSLSVEAKLRIISALTAAITIKPGAPQLELIPPKEEKS